ncbi:hypothetical protein F4677DRAFT_76932 [Hypoxylon crocopeplum]|nr:hypothetical protein F4677DRAFT_76932 [Hypoxylon crocopeplum]
MIMYAYQSFRRLIIISLHLLSVSPKSVRAQPTVRIISPREQETFYYLDAIRVTYKTNLASPWIETWCEVNGVPQEKSHTEVDGSSASALIQLSFKDGSPCWFTLGLSDGNESQGANSPSFNYIATERSEAIPADRPSSISASLGIRTPAAVLEASTNSTATKYRMAESVAEANSPSDLGMSRVHVGIGVGAAVAGILLGALSSIMCMRYRWKKCTIDQKPEENGTQKQGGRAVPRLPTKRVATASTRFPEFEGNRHKQEVSPIYPDESASCYYLEASHGAWATDFAMADRQVWTDHLQSCRAEELAVSPLAVPRVKETHQANSETAIGNIRDAGRLSFLWVQSHSKPP